MEESAGHSRRRRHRRRRAAPVRTDTTNQEEFRSGAGESGLSRRPGRSGTRSQSPASSSAAPPVDDGAADPDTPTLPPDFMLLETVEGLHSQFTLREVMEYGRRPGARSQASSSLAAPRSDCTGAQGRTHVRQSVLYSDRPRHSRLRRQARAQEHATSLSSIDLHSPVMNLPTSEVLPLSDLPHSVPETSEEIHDDHPGAEGRTNVRHSVLYSDRPRHSRLRRQARAQEHATSLSSIELRSPVMNLPTSEALPLSDLPHPIPETSEEIYHDSELGTDVKDLPPFEGLSLSDNTLFSPQPAEESDDYYDELIGDVGWRDHYYMPPKGVTKSMLDSLGDSILTTLPDMDQPRPDSDDDSEEFLRELQEYLDAFPPCSLSETFDSLVENEHATLTALAAEWGTEPPKPPQLRRDLDQKAQSVQVAEQASSVAAHTRHGAVPRESRPEASMEEIIRNGKVWMNKEVMLCFEKHVERSAYLRGLENYCLDELLHQCFSVESYNKVYHHYNFTVKMKTPSSDDWVVELYFAEVKEMFGRKYYFCCPLEPDENGCCYACQSQGVEDLKHPAIGGFSRGALDATGFGLWYSDD